MINRALIAIAIAAGFSAPALAADASVCVTSPTAIRSAAANAQPDQAVKALRLVTVGEKLCEAGGRSEASKKFAAAAKALGTDLASLTTATVSAQ